MKAYVDRDTCTGCGLCEGICPDVFTMDSTGLADAADRELDGKLLECAREAVDSCPVEAISVL